MSKSTTPSDDGLSDADIDKSELEEDAQGDQNDDEDDFDDSDEDDSDEDDSDADDEQVDASDYLGSEDDNASKKEDDDSDFKKRYADSSREAQKLAAELKKKQQEIDEWVDLVKSDAELQEMVRKKTGKDVASDQRLSEINQRLARIERNEKNDTIKRFESGKSITPAVRSAMKPLVSLLVKTMPLEDALDVAYLRVNRTGIVKDAADKGKKQALAKSKTNEDATYTTSNNASADTKKYHLTKEEAEYFRNMPGTPEKKKAQIEFYLKNKGK